MPGGDGGPGRRDALIIASGQYQDRELGELRSPSRDAEEFAEVLRDQAIGGFGVQVLLDEPGHLLREEIDGFFAERRPEDLLVLYLSCHGVKDVAGQLHFAASTTKLSRLASTGISAGFVYEQAERCRARKILLLLDCCYSGAYLKGHRPRAENRAGIKPLDGQGRAVITSCTALEYAFEIDSGQVTAAPAPSVFTAALVEGLRTGRADRDGDGLVSVDELYAYVFDRVRETTPHQTPEKKWAEAHGEFIIARNPRPPARPAQPLPPATPAGTAGHARQHVTTRRVLLGLATASAAGLAVTGWDLSHHTAAARPPRPKTTPAATPLWTFQGSAGGMTVEAVTGGVVYASASAGLFALRARDGRKLWYSKNLRYLAAAADGSVVYAGGANALYALRAGTGRKIWHAPIAVFNSPGMTNAVAGKGVLYAADGYGEVYALRASDGAKLWSYATSQGESAGVAVAGDVVYTAGANLGASVYALRAGAEIWRSSIGQVFAGPEVARGNIYVIAAVGTRQRLHALRASDGTNLWTSSPMFFAAVAPLISGGVLYIEGHHAFYALRASNGAKLWTFHSPAGQPLVAGGAVYLRTVQEAYALRASNGTKIWSFAADNGIRAIASAADTVYVASNNLYALRASDGTKLWSFPVETYSVIAVAGGAVYFATSGGKVYALRA